MANKVDAPDTIFEHPAFSTLNPNTGTPVTTTGGRLMSSGPHTDGLILFPAQMLSTSLGTNTGGSGPTVTRNAKGDWSINVTAGGAVTPILLARAAINNIVRLGEKYNLNSLLAAPAAPAKGIRIKDVFACFNCGVALPSAMTIRLGSSQYEAPAATLADTGAAIVQTDLLAATSIAPSALTTASDYVTQLVAVAVPAFISTDITQLEVELSVTFANSGTLQLASLGLHCDFNYT